MLYSGKFIWTWHMWSYSVRICVCVSKRKHEVKGYNNTQTFVFICLWGISLIHCPTPDSCIHSNPQNPPEEHTRSSFFYRTHMYYVGRPKHLWECRALQWRLCEVYIHVLPGWNLSGKQTVRDYMVSEASVYLNVGNRSVQVCRLH